MRLFLPNRYTDVTILVPKQQSVNVGLHTLGLLVKSVSVNGKATEYLLRDALINGQNGNAEHESISSALDEPASTKGMSR